MTLTAVVDVFVRVVAAVVVSIASPHAGYALPVGAVELVGLASQVLGHTHAALVHQLGRVVTLALSL